jgi:hypothetical protein
MGLSNVLFFNKQCALEKFSPRRAVTYSCSSQIDENRHKFERVARDVTFINVEGAVAKVALERLVTSLTGSAGVQKHRRGDVGVLCGQK